MKRLPLNNFKTDPRLKLKENKTALSDKANWSDPRLHQFKAPAKLVHTNPPPIISKRRLTEDIIARINDLPSLPTVVLKIMELIDDNTSSATAIEKYLRQDPGLTARLLRLVNSSFFGLRYKVVSIPQAIMLVGYSSLKSLVLAASTSPLFKGSFPGYGFKESGLWQHSFLIASWAQKLAKELGWTPEDTEEIFVAGLLHDIGKMIMSTYITKHCKEMYTALFAYKGQIISAEQYLTGIDHTEIGGKIAQKWNFSDKLEFIIKSHHDKQDASLSEKEVSLLQLVNHLVTKNGFGMYEHFPLNNELPEKCLASLHITNEIIETFQQKITTQGEILM